MFRKKYYYFVVILSNYCFLVWNKRNVGDKMKSSFVFTGLTKKLIQNQLEIWRKVAQNNGYDIEYKIIKKDEKQCLQEIKENK